MLQDYSKKKDTSETMHREFNRMSKKSYNVADKKGKYSYDTYHSMITTLPNKISMLDQEINIQQMDEELDFFQLLLKFPTIPNEITEKEFILSLLYKIQQLQNDELLLKFSIYIIDLYDFDLYEPPEELIQYVIQIISNVTFPLQSLQEKIISNLFIFLCEIYDYIDESIIYNQEFNSYLTQFFNTSTMLNSAITYFLTLLASNCESPEILSYFPALISDIYKCIVPSEMQYIQENGNNESINTIMNITSIVSSFANTSLNDSNYFILNAEPIILPLSDLWGISDDINSNLIDIISTISKIAILMFPNPNLADQLHLFFELIQHCLDNGGSKIVLDSLMTSSNYSTESLLLLKRLIHINFSKGTSFLFESPNDLYPIFKQICNFCAEGRMPERRAAGCCLSKIIRLFPNILLEFFTTFGGMESLQLTPDEISEFNENPDLAVIGLIASLLYLDDKKLNMQLIKALFVISKRYNDMDKMHEFREACAYFTIEEKINSITAKYENGDDGDNDDIYDLGNNFVNTAFGAIPYSEVDVPN